MRFKDPKHHHPSHDPVLSPHCPPSSPATIPTLASGTSLSFRPSCLSHASNVGKWREGRWRTSCLGLLGSQSLQELCWLTRQGWRVGRQGCWASSKPQRSQIYPSKVVPLPHAHLYPKLPRDPPGSPQSPLQACKSGRGGTGAGGRAAVCRSRKCPQVESPGNVC